MAASSSSEAQFLKDHDLPGTDLPPEKRLQQLMASRNEWKLYPRTCDATGEHILAAYPPDSPYKVYKNEYWWGDGWDGLEYGREFDFNRPFFEQFYELQLAVPREGTSVFESENCQYNSHTRYSKNCYMNSLVVRAEDMHYSYWMVDVENVVDCCFHIQGKSALCYECTDFSTCYECVNLQEGYNCNDCHFSFQLRGCDHCIFCSNLSQKSYHIRNKPCTKEEFESLRNTLINGSYEALQNACTEFRSVRDNALHRGGLVMNCEGTIGDHMFDSKNCVHCFDGDHSEDCSNCVSLNDSKDIHSCYSAGWPRCEQLYRCCVSRGCTDMAFCRYMWSSSNMLYCDSCQTCKHGFGCIGLRHKDYCILNRQYEKQEYEALLAKIIEHMKSTGEWGAFWPFQILPFAYNESSAQDYFPLTQEEAVSQGFLWREIEDPVPQVEKIIDADRLPDSIDDVPDDVLNWAIRCEQTGKPFRIIKGELEFYRRMRLPIPHLHPNIRHKHRMDLRSPYMLYTRNCDECSKQMESPYTSDAAQRVVCEDCYLSEVY